MVTTEHVVRVPCVAEADIPKSPPMPPIADNADVEQRATWTKLYQKQQADHIAALRAMLIECSTKR